MTVLLKRHTFHTSAALKQAGLLAAVRRQVRLGSLCNDLCEFTEQAGPVIKDKRGISDLFGVKEAVTSHLAIYQSHYGNLASLHCMAKAAGEPARVTMAEIRNWLDFLNQVALGRTVAPDRRICADNAPVSPLFADHKIQYRQIFASDDAEKIRLRSVGMMLHLIQDSFTDSHCERDGSGRIQRFYCYQEQDAKRHQQSDNVAGGREEALAAACAECVRDVLGECRSYDCRRVFRLSPSPKASGGGPFVKQGGSP